MDYLILSLVIIICFLIYGYYKKISNYFENIGVPYVLKCPLIGYMAEHMFQQKHITEVLSEIYNQYPDAKYVGAFDFTEPVYVLRDLELIKNITIRNSESFPDRKPYGDQDLDPLFGGNLFNLLGDKWKESRTILTRSFTCSKMKMMFNLMVDCAKNVENFLEKQSDESKKMINSEDLFAKYANDVIASCAFGINVNSLENPNNEFYTYGKIATNLKGILAIKLFMSRVCPNLMKFFKIRLFSEDIANFFTNIVRDTIKIRDEKGISRPDMIQLMMDARSKERKYTKMDIVEMTGHAFVFFFAGFSTTSSTICMIAHELAINPDVQKKIQDEIDEVMKTCNGKPTYEAINGMIYLDAVFNELNRLHSQGFMIDRVCKLPFELPPALPGGKSVQLQPGNRVLIPASAIHRDPKNYENPNEFIPDRYYKKKITTNDASNLNFGIGPRSCIGNRFAILEIKILFFHLLAKFNFKANEKTCSPVRYSKKTITLCADGGFWFAVESRRKNEELSFGS